MRWLRLVVGRPSTLPKQPICTHATHHRMGIFTRTSTRRLVGKGLPIPGDLLPLIAVPTTAGTGSETTGVSIFDDIPSKSKTGIAHRRLKPTLGVIDPHNTATLPPEVVKYSGLDVLCHAIESYTALPYNQRPKPQSPLHRPAYQGSNPISDVWSLHALRTAAEYLSRAVRHPEDGEARSEMLLAAAAAGVGFGNAGVHLCHGMSYPVASQVKSYVPPGYDGVDHPLVPHGHSVIVNAPSVFEFTGRANPGRHLECARILRYSHILGALPLLPRVELFSRKQAFSPPFFALLGPRYTNERVLWWWLAKKGWKCFFSFWNDENDALFSVNFGHGYDIVLSWRIIYQIATPLA